MDERHFDRRKFRTAKASRLACDPFVDREHLTLILRKLGYRRRAAQLSERLIAASGSLVEALCAPEREVVRLAGEDVANDLRLIRSVAARLIRGRVAYRHNFRDAQDVRYYCHAVMACEPVEQFRLFYLDHGDNLIAEEMQQRGTINRVDVYPREVVKRALELSARSIVMVHNHPSGDPSPSRADIDVTADIVKTCLYLGIDVLDHLIVARRGHFSFQEAGLL